MKKIFKRSEIRFAAMFFMIYGLLYIVNYTLTGLIQPGGYYAEWLNENLDYVTAFRTFLLSSTASVTEFFGHDTYLLSDTLFVKNGHNIRMVYSCMGINILCIWWAFIIALSMSAKKKVLHFTLGTLCLVALNVTRLSLLTMSPNDFSFGQLVVDHHTIYNWIVYGLILMVIKRIIDTNVAPNTT